MILYHGSNIAITQVDLSRSNRSSNYLYGNNMSITKDQFQLMVESITSDLIQHLVGIEGYTLQQAIDTVYGSDLYAALNRPTTGLYNQSTGYVVDYLMREVKNGKL